MNLSKIRLVHEDEHTFHLHNGVKPFVVHKKYIRPETLKQITQHFAEGGKVDKPKFDERGHPIEEASRGEWETASPAEHAAYLAGQKSAADAANLRAGEAAYQNAVAPGNRPPGSPDISGAPSPAALLKNFNSTAQPDEANMTPAAGFTPAPPMAQPTPTAQPQAAPPSAAIVPPKQATGGGGGGFTSTINKALKESTAAETEKANVAAEEGRRKAVQEQTNLNEQAATSKEWSDKWNAVQDRANQVSDDLANSKLDPERWWKNRNTGQKIAGTIGLILGGIGQAFGGGPNQALALIDKSIERDVDAQKVELGKKENQLSHYLQQGHSIMAARQLVMADHKDAAAGQMRMVADSMEGPAAKAIAKQNSAALTVDAAKMRQAAMAQGQEMALRDVQIKQARQDLDQRAQQQEAIKQFAKGESGELNPLLPKEITERAVKTPSGTWALVKGDKEAAANVQKTFEITSQIKASIAEYRALLNKGAARFTPTDLQEIESIRSDILANMGHLHDLNRLTDVDLHLFMGQVPNIAKPNIIGQGHAAALDALGRSIDRKILAKLNGELMGGGGGAGQSQQPLVRYP
jgi:hypothetical protein